MSISLKENRHETLTAAQKETLEELRETGVPRYLFRGWHYGSGGGPKETINSTEEIIPHGSMNDREGHDFYELQESELKSMLECHYDGKTDISSEISSWAASLMMIIFFAKRQQNLGYKGVHIALIDTHQLANDVLVWHAPHLNQEFEGCIHEYFAHGPIRGPGYKAVPYDLLEERGVKKLFPELLEVQDDDMWGDDNRSAMFSEDCTGSLSRKATRTRSTQSPNSSNFSKCQSLLHSHAHDHGHGATSTCLHDWMLLPARRWKERLCI